MAENNAPLKAASKNPSRILYVDTDEFLSLLLAEKLKQLGFQVELLSDCNKAISRMKSKSFRLLVTEILLGDQDGYELLHRVKNTPGLKRPNYIMVLTGLSERDKEDELAAIGLGASCFMIKSSHTPTEILHKIKSMAEQA